MEKQNRPALTLQERIDAIRNSESIDQLTSDILPKSHQEDYYFVSYSHLDYREVLVDILQMEEQGLHFWYDTDIHIGENWEHIAKSYISKFQCKGVIFYLSKSSINSPACNKEIKYVVDHGINYFSINLPLDEETPICSGKDMVDILKNTEGFTFNESINLAETARLFGKHFHKDIIYLPYTETTTKKVDEIKKTLKGKDLFEFRFEVFGGVKLSACRDNSLVSVTIPSEVTIEQIANKDEFDSDYLDERDLHVTKIGEAAFANFFSLEEVILPECLVEIENLAFTNCKALKKINLHSCTGLECIGSSAFKNCISLEDAMLLSQSLFFLSIGVETFRNCTNLTNVIIPSATPTIGEKAFYGCESLSSVAFGENSWLTTIGAFAFADCESLTNIIIPNNVTVIEHGAFQSCSNLTSIFIPSNVATIGSDAFDGCDNLTDIFYAGAEEDWDAISIDHNNNIFEAIIHYNCAIDETGLVTSSSTNNKILVRCLSTATSISIPENVTSICKDAFNDCTSLTSVTIPTSVITIDERAFSGCYYLAEVFNYSSLDITKGSEDYGHVAYYALDVYTTNEPSQLANNNGLIIHSNGTLVRYIGIAPDVVIPEHVITINNGAFAFCDRLTSISIPSSVTAINALAFYGCDNLSTITFGENSQLTTIDFKAFSDCNRLTAIKIPASVTNIEPYAFSNCTDLTIVTFDKNSQLNTIEHNAFSGCTGLTSITIPTSATFIDERVFDDCTGLTNINVATDNASYKSIDGNLYTKDEKTLVKYAIGKPDTSFAIPDFVTTIGEETFFGCNSLTSIDIPNSVTTIGDCAFNSCESLTNVTFGENSQLTTIGEWAFNSCESLTSITIPSSVTTVGKGAFSGCLNLKEIINHSNLVLYRRYLGIKDEVEIVNMGGLDN